MKTHLCLLLPACLSLFASCLHGQTAKIATATPVFAKGKVEIVDAAGKATAIQTSDKDKTTKAVNAAVKPGPLPSCEAGGSIRTGADGSGNFLMGAAGGIRLRPDTEVRLPAPKEADSSLELLKGRLFLNIKSEELKKRGNSEFRLKTPAALLAVKGTKFNVTSKDGMDVIAVHEGTVAVMDLKTKEIRSILAGRAVTAGPNGISPARFMTEAEKAEAAEYRSLELVEDWITLVAPSSNRTGTSTQRFCIIMSGKQNETRNNRSGAYLPYESGVYDLKPIPQGEYPIFFESFSAKKQITSGSNSWNPHTSALDEKGIIRKSWGLNGAKAPRNGNEFDDRDRIFPGNAALTPAAFKFRFRTELATTAVFSAYWPGSVTDPARTPAPIPTAGQWTEVEIPVQGDRISSADGIVFMLDILFDGRSSKEKLPVTALELADLRLVYLPN